MNIVFVVYRVKQHNTWRLTTISHQMYFIYRKGSHVAPFGGTVVYNCMRCKTLPRHGLCSFLYQACVVVRCVVCHVCFDSGSLPPVQVNNWLTPSTLPSYSCRSAWIYSAWSMPCCCFDSWCQGIASLHILLKDKLDKVYTARGFSGEWNHFNILPISTMIYGACNHFTKLIWLYKFTASTGLTPQVPYTRIYRGCIHVKEVTTPSGLHPSKQLAYLGSCCHEGRPLHPSNWLPPNLPKLQMPVLGKQAPFGQGLEQVVALRPGWQAPAWAWQSSSQRAGDMSWDGRRGV